MARQRETTPVVLDRREDQTGSKPVFGAGRRAREDVDGVRGGVGLRGLALAGHLSLLLAPDEGAGSKILAGALTCPLLERLR